MRWFYRHINMIYDGIRTTINIVNNRFGILSTLGGNPTAVSELQVELNKSRVTIYRALETLTEEGLIRSTGDTYVRTRTGRLAAARFRSLLDSGLTEREVELVGQRPDLLEHLGEERMHKRDLIDRLTWSRSTVDRALDDLGSAELVRDTPSGWVPTENGGRAVRRDTALARDLHQILATTDVLTALPDDVDVPMGLVLGADATLLDDRTELFDRIVTVLGDSSEYRVALPFLIDSRHLRACHFGP